MEQIWRAILDLMLTSFQLGEARRLTNLVLAASLAKGSRSRPIAPQWIEMQTRTLAGKLDCQLDLNGVDWAQLAIAVKALETGPLLPPTIDAWVEVFQAADGSRKSLGAFATPAPFADALAKALLAYTPKLDSIRVLDPAAGAGNLLAAVYRSLLCEGQEPGSAIRSLYGVELDPAARELCVLQLWLSTPLPRPPIEEIAARIVVDNAVTRDWWSNELPFDAVIMNPPWDSLRHSASNDAVEGNRLATLDRLAKPRMGAEGLPPLYTAHGRGDRNLFKAFVELAPHLLKAGGRVSALLPAAFGSDDGMSQLRCLYLEHLSLERWTTYENRSRYFAIDSRYKFGLLSASRSDRGTRSFVTRSFCKEPVEVNAAHIALDVAELSHIGGPDKMIPELTTEIERDILAKMMTKGLPLFERGPFGSVIYRREVDLTLGRAAGRFIHVDDNAKPDRNHDLLSFGGDEAMVPVLEGRMVGQYDCFQKSFIGGSGRTAVWQENGERPLINCRSQFVAPAREACPGRVAICDVTSATNTRTVLATLVPRQWLCGNTAPVLQFENEDLALAGLPVLNSLVFDWMARRIISGLHLNKFYLACLCWPALESMGVHHLSKLGRAIASAFPRGGLSESKKPNSKVPDRLAAMIEAELLIATAYALNSEELAFMLSDERTDRRGFWRYYASAPDGEELARLTLERFRTAERLAA